MSQVSPRLSIPETISEKLISVRGRSFKAQVATASVVAVVVLLAAMGLAMLVDYLAVLYDSRWRVVLTAAALLSAAATLIAWVVVGWRYTRRLRQSAEAVDRHFPDLQERWTTVTSLADSPDSARDVHPAMYRKVATEADRFSGRVQSEQVVRYDGVVRGLISLTVVSAILVAAVAMNPLQTTVLMRRFWSPQSYISATKISHSPDGAVIGRGESLDLTAQLDGLPVKKATLMMHPAAGESKELTLIPRVGDEQTHIKHRIRSVQEPLQYRFRAGDGQTPWYEVAVADRPKIANSQVTITPPEYTRQKAKRMKKLPRRVTVMEGSRLEIALQPKHAVESIEIRLNGDENQSFSQGEDGWYRWSITVEESFSFSPLLTEEHGLTNRKPPKCRVICKPDRPPVVKVLTPENDVAVRPDDTLNVTFVAKDDVGIGSAELVVKQQNLAGKLETLKTIPVPLGEDQGSKDLRASVELDLAEFELKDGAQLSYVVRVFEQRGQSARSNAEEGELSGRVQTIRKDAGENAQPSSSVSQSAENGTKQPTQPNEDAPTAGASESRADAARKDESGSTELANNDAEEPTAQDAGTSIKRQPDRSVAQAETSDSQADSTPVDNGQQTTEADSRQDAENSVEEQSQSPRTGEESIEESEETDESTTEGEKDLAASDAESTTGGDSSKATQNNRQSSSSPNKDAQAAEETSPNQNQPSDNNSNQTGSKSTAERDQKQQSPSNGPPPDNMAKNSVDVAPRASNSQQMRLKIDQWAGSFEGQQRRKLELVIGPLIEKLHSHLEKAELLSRAVLDEWDASATWQPKQNRDVSQAEKRVAAAIQVIDDLTNQTQNTPYAFIGLQLFDISRAHVEPARRDFWKGLQLDEEKRVEAVRNGWQHVQRARELLLMLTERFEKAKREYALAESVEEIKKMHRIFVEESMALLKPPGEGGVGYNRKPVEFDFDEEYLKRLKEVIEMRNRMRKELARILREDPRLLRRFLDAQKNRLNNLRHDLYDLVDTQQELNREVSAWAKVDDSQRDELAKILLGRHIESSQDIALATADLMESFETWRPLRSTSQDAEFESIGALLEKIGTTAREITFNAEEYVTQELSKEEEESEETESDSSPPQEKANLIAEVDKDSEKLYDELNDLEVRLRQLGLRSDQLEIASFATNRLVETRNLIARSSAWVRQLRQQQQGNYHRAAEVAQYQVARDTEALVAKLANVELAISGLLQRPDGRLPPQIAESVREMFAVFDEQAAPNQQAAIYSLRRNQLPRASERQSAALAALQLASEKYDEMIKRAITELDKLPVQDPIASLLDDPTLDELLGELEQEFPIEDILGIPARRSNLQIVGDFLRPAGDNGLITGQPQQRLMNQLRQQRRLRRRQLDRARQEAIKRALKEVEAEDLVDEDLLKLAGENSDWNVLLSQLGDDLRQGRDKAPPERYRRAIEQYFRQISRDAKSDD